jgi:type IV secretory pathway TrbD component
MQEPRNGDFVAYIDALQRESAMRLSQQHLNMAAAGFPSRAATAPTADKALPHAAGTPTDSAANEAVRRGRVQGPTLVKALVAAVVGTVALLSWLRGSGALSFIVGAALLAYAVPRLLAVYRKQVREPDSRVTVEHVFGRSGTPTTGAKQ